MGEPPPKRMRISAEQEDEQETESEVEVLDNSAESDTSTEATLGGLGGEEDFREEDFEVIESHELESDHEGDYEFIESPQYESSHEGDLLELEDDDEWWAAGLEGDEQDQWWAAGPEGELQFLLLLEEPFVTQLGDFGLSSGDPLPFGWVVDEDALRDYALANESKD